MAEGAEPRLNRRRHLRSDLALLEILNEQIQLIEEKIAALAVEDQQVRLLMTMTGIGYFTAMLILTEICTIERFSSEKKLSSWMGLAPSVHQSGEKTRIGSIAPGNKRLRWVTVQSGQFQAFHDESFLLGGFWEESESACAQGSSPMF